MTAEDPNLPPNWRAHQPAYGTRAEQPTGFVERRISKAAETVRLLFDKEKAQELFWPFRSWHHQTLPQRAHLLAASWARELAGASRGSLGGGGSLGPGRFTDSAQAIAQGGIFGPDAVEEAEQELDRATTPAHLEADVDRIPRDPRATRLLIAAAYGWLAIEKPVVRLLVKDK